MIQSCIVCICWTFSSVCVQMSPQIACLREGIFALVAFIPFLVTVCYQMFVQNACTRGNKVAHLHPPKSTSPPPKKVHFIPPLKFFQRTKTTKLKVKVNVFAAQVHVEDLVVAHIEQNLTMYYAKLE